MTRCCVLLALVLISPAFAQVAISVEPGWGGSFRPGTWTPVFVTFSSETPISVVLETTSEHAGNSWMVSRQLVTSGPARTTIPVHVVPGYSMSGLRIRARSPESWRILGECPADESDADGTALTSATPSLGRLIGVSGPPGAGARIRAALESQKYAVGEVPLTHLPSTPAGYQGLSLLVLPRADLSRLQPDQQSALKHWVRCGGSLLLWLEDGPIPATGALREILPADPAPPTIRRLDPAAVSAAGLSDRFVDWPERSLELRPRSESVVVIAGVEARAARQRVGLGTVMLLSFDPTLLLFSQPANERALWATLAQEALPAAFRRAESFASTSPQDAAIDALADIPGAGAFDMRWSILWLLGLAAIVGPIDWMVLKRIGHQPWTWVTTLTVIAASTIAMVALGGAIKSGELRVNSLRVTDIVEEESVADMVLSCLYAPRTTSYTLQGEPSSWWQPFNLEMRFGSAAAHKAQMLTDQAWNANLPAPMVMPIWSLRLFRSDRWMPEAPALTARIRKEPAANGAIRFAGTIRNHLSEPVVGLVLRSRTASVQLENLQIAPGSSATIDTLATDNRLFSELSDAMGKPHRPQQGHPTLALTALEPSREALIEGWIESDPSLIVVYAEHLSSKPPVSVKDQSPVGTHRRLIRLLTSTAEAP
jgi:hypothetical protein